MRISDWSSDVCSSDLVEDDDPLSGQRPGFRGESFRPDRPVQSDQAALAYQGADSDGSASASARSASSPWSPIPGYSSRARARISRSEERRVGNEWVSTGISRWSPEH